MPAPELTAENLAELERKFPDEGLDDEEVEWLLAEVRRLRERVAVPSPEDVVEWNERNFPDSPSHWPIMCVAEEAGELLHAALKREQGIRRNQDHDAAIRDAIGDTTIALMSVCWREGLSFRECVREAWERVKDRDWREERLGLPPAAPDAEEQP